MTSIINNSNANSALINTLESSDSMTNPNVYSTKEIYPMSATTWTTNQKSNGVSTPGNQMNFNLNKYGIIEQILFNYRKTTTAGAVGGGAILEAGDMFNVIDRVELLSASRVISVLTGADLLAQFSNLNSSQYEPIKRTAVDERGAEVTTSLVHNYVVPLTFGFMQDINTQLNSSFLEPLSLRVTYASSMGHFISYAAPAGTPPVSAASDANTGTIDNTFLYIRYKSYPEAATAQILASNYNAPELVQVSTRFYDENPVTLTSLADATADSGQSMKIQLRNTDCVEDFYVMVRKVNATDGSFGNPMELKSIRFTGSGQEIMFLNEQAIPYARLTENGFSSSSIAGVAGGLLDTSNMRYVGKIQTGLYEHSGGGPISNSLSLRELNAPEIEVTFSRPSGASIYRLDLVENCTAIYSTSSSVGRLSLALSN